MSKYNTRVFEAEIELRQEEGEPPKLRGIAVPYDKRSREFWGGWYEIIERGAGRNTLTGPADWDLQLLRSHNRDAVLARTGAGTLTLTDTERGVEFEAELRADTQINRDTVADILAGNLGHMSFGFEPVKERWRELPDGKEEVVVEEIILHEISIVTQPAYGNATSVLVRDSAGERWKARQREKSLAVDRARARALRTKGKGLISG